MGTPEPTDPVSHRPGTSVATCPWESLPDGRGAASLERVRHDEDAEPVAGARTEDVVEALALMVQQGDYPCLGARSVFNRERATVRVFDELGTPDEAARLLRELEEFAGAVDVADGFASFVAAFRGPEIEGEEHFERLLWQQLRTLTEIDQTPWNDAVSSDPDDPHFGFSVAGRAFFVVGLNPAASRLARRTPVPVLVFNLHEQFDLLRRSDQYERMRDLIRRRDIELQGGVNPMVADHGVTSEARQYAGRAVGQDWSPPVPLTDGAAPSTAETPRRRTESASGDQGTDQAGAQPAPAERAP